MYKELFNFVQSEVKCIAEELDKHNSSQSKQMIEERLELLDILQRIQPLENKDPDPESQTVEETLSVENDQSSTNEKDEIVNQSLYEFQRKAVGGELQSLSESRPSLFIPETVIRDLEGATETQEKLKKLFGSAGINHQLLRGDESGVKISSAVRKSDAVIVITPFTERHAGSQQANKYCKEYNVPFRQSKTYGVKTITNLISVLIFSGLNLAYMLTCISAF
ncbi:DUF2325 domain-containing protein [Bacillus velezensis]|uniref:DUF2325 domain-containing protein n=1 Tax=Bacillus amyloliquefaciens group TaxID=1938374 RepID=UPI00077D72F0|nr:DUF2325 domain-containing protein [Bacillus amyloliquefaciens]AMQ71223.1 hypothetical protein BAMY6639_00585 [Bacillus amyloliquefaciens UMAF6639]